MLPLLLTFVVYLALNGKLQMYTDFATKQSEAKEKGSGTSSSSSFSELFNLFGGQ